MFYNLEKQGIEIYKGFMLRSDGKYHEKVVDVKMAEYSVCYLILSDTDIIPAILEAKKVKKKIIYVGFEGKLSLAMVRNCSSVVEINPSSLKGPFLP